MAENVLSVVIRKIVTTLTIRGPVVSRLGLESGWYYVI
jgi:hypothetical protein